MTSVDILNLEWRSFPSRDRDAASLIANYLRLLGLNVFEGCVFQGYELIRKHNPKLIYITNSVGAEINLKLIKYAKSRGIICVSGVAEGNFRSDGIEEFVWGHNRERVLYEDRLFVWSEQAKQMTLDAFPELSGRVQVSGAVGFDLYQMIRVDRNWLWERTGGTRYEKVVGVGCWDFGITSPEDARYDYFLNYYGHNAIERFRQERDEFNDTLLELIAGNPDILFILKEHPGRRLGYWASGIVGCERFPNAVIERNGVSIKECIQASNVWISYESNTAMEAWLYGIPSGLLNPRGTEFPNRHAIHRGQPNFRNIREWQEALDCFYSSGELPGFSERAGLRETIIRNTMQWHDGLNHVRLGNGIFELLEADEKRVDASTAATAPNFPTKLEVVKQWILWHGSPWLNSRNRTFRDYWNKYRSVWHAEEVVQYADALMQLQLDLFKRLGYSVASLRQIKPL
ncbi:MAG: hypothetical protein KDI74_02090 [Gammaproteobacteria bacterium]|nr:hypothetical protein [Gammaproteobacteria bacterium]